MRARVHIKWRHTAPVAHEAVQHSGAGAKAETPSKNAARTPPACASRTQIAVPVSARVPICVCVASQRVCVGSQRVCNSVGLINHRAWGIMPYRPHPQTRRPQPRSPRRHARHEKKVLQ
jgi:hypothetical protein